MIKTRIIWLAHEANISGANLCLKEFMIVAKDKGLDQCLIIPHKGSMEQVAAELKIPVKIIPYYFWTRPANGYFFDKLLFRRLIRNTVAVFQLMLLTRRGGHNLFFTNTSVVNVGGWASKLTGSKHYWYVHEMGEEDFGFKLPWGKKSYWFMKNFADKVLTNSYHLASKYLNRYPSLHIEVIRYPVFVKKAENLAKWSETIPVKLLLIGQIAKTKGQHIAIEAVKILINRGIDVTLTIMGKCDDKSFEEEINLLIKKCSLNDKVFIEGFTSVPTEVMANHHILLMCSRCEAFGRVTAEAMKIGIPVVGSNSCGTKEIITDNITGYLFETGNAGELAQTILKVINNPAQREEIVMNALNHINEMTDTNNIYRLFDQI